MEQRSAYLMGQNISFCNMSVMETLKFYFMYTWARHRCHEWIWISYLYAVWEKLQKPALNLQNSGKETNSNVETWWQ